MRVGVIGLGYVGRNLAQAAAKVGHQVVGVDTNPDVVAGELAFESAIFFFNRNKLWDICDKGVNDASILSLTKKINGGTNGLQHRSELTKKYYAWLKK